MARVQAIRIATRGSSLARWQASWVGRNLVAAGVAESFSLVVVSTHGDRMPHARIEAIAGSGVFVAEVRAAVVEGRAEIAVHSAKDLPSDPALVGSDLVIAAVPERGDVRDALVGLALDELPAGATVATGSARRRAQLAWLRPDLTFRGLRGNIPTRLSRVPDAGSVVVALAALERLDLEDRAAEVLSPATMLPQVGQGALAIECLASNIGLAESVSVLDHEPSHVALDAERAFLAQVGGGCDLPVGAWARFATASIHGPGGRFENPIACLEMDALVASADGRVLVRRSARGTDPVTLGRELAEDILVAHGGRMLLDGMSSTARDIGG